MSGAVGPSADHIGAIQRRDFALTFPKQHASDNAPLVVLCGWVGCQDRFLRKYSELLNEAGYPTVRSICPKSAIFWPFEGRRRAWAADLLRFVDLASGAGSERPLVLYAFSNGGAFVAEQVDALVGGTAAPFAHLRPRLAGVAFDSAPAYLLPSSGARALGEGQPAVARAALALLFYLIMAVTLVVDPRRARNYWSAMTSPRLALPTLYLYSRDDPLACAAKLDGLVAARRAAGADARAHCWPESPHVGHLRRHPEQYKRLVLEFLGSLHT